MKNMLNARLHVQNAVMIAMYLQANMYNKLLFLTIILLITTR